MIKKKSGRKPDGEGRITMSKISTKRIDGNYHYFISGPHKRDNELVRKIIESLLRDKDSIWYDASLEKRSSRGRVFTERDMQILDGSEKKSWAEKELFLPAKNNFRSEVGRLRYMR